jgi:alpha-L-fucosidase 2
MNRSQGIARWRSVVTIGAMSAGLAVASAAGAGARYDPVKGIGKYDVVWDTQSRDARGSMPAGNGDISLNVWVEENGDLVFYIGKTDAWGDNSRLLKVGRVRVSFTPNPYLQAKAFRQTLRLGEAAVEVRYGGGNDTLRVRVWADANHPVIHVQAESRQPVEAVAAIELWRRAPFTLPSIEVSDVHFDHDVPGNQRFPTVVEPDTVLADQTGRIGWFHHNKKSVGPGLCAELQDMEGFKQDDPILHRTFGAVITAVEGRRADDLHLLSPRGRAHRFDIYVLTRHPSSPEGWLRNVEELIASTAKVPFESRLSAHRAWWQEFWSRSWIDIGSAGPADDAYVLCRGYNLQRFINACAGRGGYAIKFNGSIFTVPNPGSPGDADYRRWGPGYWWQNTRLPYISMCSSGDFDLMQPLFRMYGGDMLEMARYRTKHYLGHAGAYLNECAYFWGAAFNESYGWTPGEKRTVKVNESRWHRWEFQGGIELVQMMLDYFEHTQDEAFLRDRLIPFAREILTFYDLHYGVDEKGKIVMEPAQALETWWDCRNPMPEIAGILSVSERLMALAGERAGAEDAALWRRIHDKMPGLPTRVADGTLMLAPAEAFATKQNIENPELYAVFPYRQVALGRPGTELAVEALNHRWDRGNFGWRQEDIFMAYLGLTEEAREYLVGRARKLDENSRFPAFWGPNYDWVPDQDHGGVLLKALQAMLMQTDGRKIFLLPAWPKEWDVEFKLYAPYRTVVEGQVKDGKVVALEVRPPERKGDVLIGPIS